MQHSGGQVRDPRPSEVNFALVGPAEISLGEPLIVELTFSNARADSVKLDLGVNRVTGFSLTLDAPDGASVTIRPPEPDGFAALGTIELGPGKSVTTWLVADQWLAIAKVGQHRLRVQFVGTATSSNGGSVAVGRIADLKFQVLPPDLGRLRDMCDRLAGLALQRNGVDADAQLKVVTALASVGNAVAIPSLLKVAAANKWPAIAIGGLLRIGGQGARDALSDLSRSANRDVSDLARDALTRIKGERDEPRRQARTRLKMELQLLPGLGVGRAAAEDAGDADARPAVVLGGGHF